MFAIKEYDIVQSRSETKGEEMSDYEKVPLFMSPGELALITGTHVQSVRRGIAEGRIPADKVNGRWVICRDAVFPNAKRVMSDGDA